MAETKIIQMQDYEYHVNEKGEVHRNDGPAVIHKDGSKHWYKNGKRHRIDGPAIEWGNGAKEWYQNDDLHRDDGPAIEWLDGDKWYFRGVQIRYVKNLADFQSFTKTLMIQEVMEE